MWPSVGELARGGKTPLKHLVPEHPICRGWKEYEIRICNFLTSLFGLFGMAFLR